MSHTQVVGSVVFQFTLKLGVEPPTLSALTETLPSRVEFRNCTHKHISTLSPHLQLLSNLGFLF